MTYLPQLDGLRALALGLVVAYHADLPVPGGYHGVDLFFVLSGFLIARQLLAPGRIGILSFYRRRARRLLPALLMLLCAALLLAALWPDGRRAAALAWSSAAAGGGVLNWLRAFAVLPSGPLEHLWSLSVEFQFYLLAPLLIAALRRARGRGMMLLLALIGCLIALRLWHTAQGASSVRLYYGLDTHGDALLCGVLLAYWRPPPPLAAYAPRLVPVGLACILLLALTPRWGSDLDLTLAALVATLLVFSLVYSRPTQTRLWQHPLALWLGRRSYGLYLWHYPLFEGLRAVGLPGWASVGVGGATTLVFAELSYRFVERRFWREVGTSGAT